VAIKNKIEDEPGVRQYASSPCLMHELGPDFQQLTSSDDWESIRTWRREQRSRLITQRQSLSRRERRRFSEAICKVLESESRFGNGCIGFYWPLDGEIDVRPLMHSFLDRGVDLALPVIVEKDQPMEFWAWDANTPMQEQPIWNIPVPIERKLLVPSVLFVPMLGFDKQSHRLGHGGGYYDRTLAALASKPLTVGIGYELGRLETVHPQDHDVPMDVVVTEEGIVSKNA
jgi:5-formyltetrahydrofolate cyclo-ligase